MDSLLFGGSGLGGLGGSGFEGSVIPLFELLEILLRVYFWRLSRGVHSSKCFGGGFHIFAHHLDIDI